MREKIVLIGPGRVGTAVARRLQENGCSITAIIGRDRQRAEEAAAFIGCAAETASTDLGRAADGEIILLAVPDDHIAEVAHRLQGEVTLSGATTMVHFSGLHPAAIAKRALSVHQSVSIHPLLPFADRELAITQLSACPCAIEGDEARLPLAAELVRTFGGEPFPLPSEAKTIYHAAACISSNFLVTLTAAARDLLGQCGFDRQQAMKLLEPIHRATGDNLFQLGPEQALTGPIVRGDNGTVALHLKTLEEKAPHLLDLYRALGDRTVELAEKSNRLDRTTAEELKHRLK